MKTRTIFICEICGSEHATEGGARFCESLPICEPIAQVGDMVLIRERYEDEPTLVKVIEDLGVKPPFALGISHFDSDPEAWRKGCGSHVFTHRRGVKLASLLQLGKDYYSDTIIDSKPLVRAP